MSVVKESVADKKPAASRVNKRSGVSSSGKPSPRKTMPPLVPPDVLEELKRTDENGDFLGPVVYRRESSPDGTERGYIYVGDPYEKNPTVVRLETTATKDEVEAIRQEIIPMRESCEMLTAMAITYKLRQPLLLEGPTAVGKTFLAEKFTELLYGRGNRPLEFYCNGQTDVSELTAKWVPLTTSEKEREAWLRFLDEPETEERLADIASLAQACQGTPERKLALVHERLRRLAEEAGFGGDTRWRMLYGAIPLAMSGDFDADGGFSRRVPSGLGFTLHIEEVGLAEPQIINVLLQLRGRKGGLADSIRLWESCGERIEAGPRFWLVLSTNPPEEYFSRNEVDPALARGVVFKRVGGLRKESLELAARRIFSRRFHPKAEPSQGCLLDIYDHPEICRELADLVAVLHWEFDQALRDGEKGRSQRIPLTLDDMARVSRYMNELQVQDSRTGMPDLGETLGRAFAFYYLNRLADAELKKRLTDSLRLTLRGDLGKKEFAGKKVSRAEILSRLVQEAMMDEGEMQRIREREAQRERRQAEQADAEAKRRLDALLADPEVPDSVKAALRGEGISAKRDPRAGGSGQEDWEQLERETAMLKDFWEACARGEYDGVPYEELPPPIQDLVLRSFYEEEGPEVGRADDGLESEAVACDDPFASSQHVSGGGNLENELDRLLGDDGRGEESEREGHIGGASCPGEEDDPGREISELDLSGEADFEDEEDPLAVELEDGRETDPELIKTIRRLLGVHDLDLENLEDPGELDLEDLDLGEMEF